MVTETAAVPSASPAFTPQQIRAVITGLMLIILLGALDQTIVSVALPDMGKQLQGFDLLAWVVSGYLVAVAVATPIYGKLGDLFGRRAVLSFAIILFLIASAWCALAQSMPMLVAARILQGLGGGGLISVAQAIVADVVPPRERGRYQGYISGMYALASVAGPLVGGLLTQWLSWRWIFWINLPIGAAALLIARRTLAGLPVPRVARRVDYAGAVLLTAGLAMLLVAITRVGQGVSWSDPGNLALAGVSLAVLAVFVRRQMRVEEPIVPLSLFAIPTLRICCTVLFVAFFQVMALSVLIPLQLQLTLRIDADVAALRLIPLTLAIPLGAFFGGRMMARTGRPKPLQLAGTALVPPAIAAFALTGAGSAGASAVWMILAGIGIGLQFPTSLVSVQNAVAPRHIGIATAMTAFFRSLGAAIGVAVLTAILLALLDAERGGMTLRGAEVIREAVEGAVSSSPDAAGLAQTMQSAFRTIFLISAAVSLGAFLLALRLPDVQLSNRPRH